MVWDVKLNPEVLRLVCCVKASGLYYCMLFLSFWWLIWVGQASILLISQRTVHAICSKWFCVLKECLMMVVAGGGGLRIWLVCCMCRLRMRFFISSLHQDLECVCVVPSGMMGTEISTKIYVGCVGQVQQLRMYIWEGTWWSCTPCRNRLVEILLDRKLHACRPQLMA